MWTLLVLCTVVTVQGAPDAGRYYTDVPTTDYTPVLTCRNNCGRNFGHCSCSSSCQYYGTCCSGYTYYCPSTTAAPLTQTSGAPCGGYLAGSGTFSSPNHPGFYYDGANCVWQIQTSYDQRILLTFTFLELENCCSCDYIQVFDGPSVQSRYLGKVCNSSLSSFNSTSNYMTVNFRSDSSAVGRGFKAKFLSFLPDAPNTSPTPVVTCRNNCGRNFGHCSCSSSCQYYGTCCSDYTYYCPSTTAATPTRTSGAPCGGYLAGSGTFSSPNHPGFYYDGANCIWQIQTSYDQRILLTFTFLELENCCSCDYIQVFDGPSVQSRYLGKVCNSSLSSFNSTSNYMTVNFRSDSSAVGRGFKAKFLSFLPDAPNTSPTPVTCRNNCGRNFGHCSCSSSCQYYGTCCSDYTYYCLSTTTPTRTSGAPCGGYLAGSGTFSSPNHPGFYYDGANCIWQIQTSYDQRILLTFTFLELENCCSCDYIQVFDGPSVQSRYLGKVCNSSLSSFNSTSNYMTVNFRSDSSAVGRGFKAKFLSFLPDAPNTSPTPVTCRNNCGRNFGHCSCSSSCQYYGTCCSDYTYYCLSTTTPTRTSVAPCGGYLAGSGTFSSPNHPGFYYDGANCVWQIKTSYDQRILLTFTFLQLENCCSCDYIQVFDGPSVQSRYLGKVCNSSLSSFYSTSNYMTVNFRSNGAVVGRGFKAEFISSLPRSAGRVECFTGSMNIVLEVSYLNSLGYNGHNVTLIDPQCRPHVSWNQVSFRYPINACGNTRKFMDGKATYSNIVSSYSPDSGEISRKSFLKLNVACRMEADSVSQIMYLVDQAHHNSSIIGTGRFNTSMQFYTSSNFYYLVTQFPYEVRLNQDMYVQVRQLEYDSSLVLFLDTCVASPSAHDFQTRAYYLVRNGCPMDNTYRVYSSGTQPYARFSFKAFQFLRASESVFIQCKVLICQAYDYNSRCRRGCMTRTARDLGSEHHSQTMVLGPIKLQDPEKNEEGTEKKEKV